MLRIIERFETSFKDLNVSFPFREGKGRGDDHIPLQRKDMKVLLPSSN